MKMKKCVIIGSGLGGLSNGVILARNGYQVTIVEQAAQPGGCLQCFSRRGAKFETGMHFIGSTSADDTFRQLLRYLSLDTLPLQQLDPGGYDRICLHGDLFKIPNGWESFAEQLGSYFPSEKDNLQRYISVLENIADASSLRSMGKIDSNLAATALYQTTSINRVLDELFHDPAIKNVLAGNLPLYAAQFDKTPFALHAFIMNFYNPGAYRIVGGSDLITKSLIKTIKENGGDVRTSSKATTIVCDDIKAIGVEINNDEFIPADIVISTIHPAQTMELVDTKLIRPAFRKRMILLPDTPAVFSLYLKFKPGAVEYQNFNYYSYREGTPWGCEDYTPGSWPKGYLYMHHCSEVAQRYATSAVVLSYMNYSEVKKWATLPMGNRGADYDAFKEQHARKLLELLEKEHPGIRSKIEAFYTATPLTYEGYTSTRHGAMYGVAKDVGLGAACHVPHRTKVPNLFLSGQSINSHGMLGVLVGTIVTCSAILSPEVVYNRIINPEI